MSKSPSYQREKSILDVDYDINGKKIKTYMSFDRVKAAGVKIGFTKEMEEEIGRCANDLLYYAENYFYHVHPDDGLKKIELYPHQREQLPSLQDKRFNIFLQSRQSGKCVDYNTTIIIRNKNSLEEQYIKIGKFYDRITNSQNSRHLPIDRDEKKFIDLIRNEDFEVFTDSGWQPFKGIGKTKPFQKWEIKTSNHKLICADDHLLFTGAQKRIIKAKQLKVGDTLITKKGYDKIVSIKVLNDKKSMYDLLSVDNGKRYFTNGLLSHNSTVVSIFCTWYAIFNKNKTVVIISRGKAEAQDVLEKIKLSIENLPFGLQCGLREWNKSRIDFDNGSKIIVKADARGATGNVLLVDEAAFVKGWSEFSQSTLPILAVSKDSRLMLVSTPNGKNHFYDYWWKANLEEGHPLKKKNFVPHFVPWDIVPGRDEQWKQDMLELLGGEIRNSGGADTAEAKFEREFNCKFDSKLGSLLHADTLTWLSAIYKDPLNIDDLYNDIDHPAKLYKLKDHKDNFQIFELPIPDHKYVIGVDTSTNTDTGEGDETSFQILDITTVPIKQVATFEAIYDIHYRKFPYILEPIGHFYNYAWIFIENNEGAGRETNRTLEDLGYEHIYWENLTLAGFRTTQKTKRLGCQNLKLIADNFNLEIYDIGTTGQLGNFVRKKSSYGGDNGEPDDKVMALIASLFFLMIDDDVMLGNIFGDSDMANHHHIFQKIINKGKNIKGQKFEEIASILNEQDAIDILLRDDPSVIEERIMRNMNLKDEKKTGKKFDIFDLMEEDIKEREHSLGIRDEYIPF